VSTTPSETLAGFQRRIEALYGERDKARGLDRTFVWFVEEVGELARALHRRDRKNLVEEFADCLAWLTTLASMAGVDMAEAASRYRDGCPRCRATPCSCPGQSS
jgi:NTP pyrophosphatase (non-canonical NTP hydrolase)